MNSTTTEEFKKALKEVIKEKKALAEIEAKAKLEKDNKEGGDKLMPGEDAKKLEELEGKINELKTLRESEKKELKELEDAHNKELEAFKKELDEKATAKAKTDEEARKKELEETTKKLAEYDKKLAERDKELHLERVESRTKELVDKGFWPAVVNKVKKVMLADTNLHFGAVKLSDKEEDKDKEISLSEAIVEILNEIPEDVRISFDERTKKVDTTSKKFMSEDEVAKYAEEQNPKLSYEEACSRLSAEGRIENITLQ